MAQRCHVAKAIFRKAERWGWIASSPFAHLKAGSQSNPDRLAYVDRETVRRVLDACPDNQWRAIIALTRFAGLRCPSELTRLTWQDVNWEKGRLTVRSPKTAGHEGHAIHMTPIDPDLRPILLRLFEQAAEGEPAVIPRLHDPGVNLRMHLLRIIARAGVEPWPRLYHNLRASCATEWAERFPAHAVAKWLGHSPLIAAQHYLQVRDQRFDAAAGLTGQGAAKYDDARSRTDSPEDERIARNLGTNRLSAT